MKTTLVTLERKQTSVSSNKGHNAFHHFRALLKSGLITSLSGNLSTKSLSSIVDPSTLVQSSEYLESHVVAVPNPVYKDFIKSYETISPMVVPRSCLRITADSEYTLYAVTTFKKYSHDFVQRSRERRWIPRDFRYVEGGREAELKEVQRVGGDERRVWGEVLRLGRTGWGDAVMAWIHVLALRVFVETVLRYGLPSEYICGLVQVSFFLISPPFGVPPASDFILLLFLLF